MPLYEVVLRYPERDEIRWTDRDPSVQGRLNIHGHQWRIVGSMQGTTHTTMLIERRFIAVPAESWTGPPAAVPAKHAR
jgi:hypothetical protein